MYINLLWYNKSLEHMLLIINYYTPGIAAALRFFSSSSLIRLIAIILCCPALIGLAKVLNNYIK